MICIPEKSSQHLKKIRIYKNDQHAKNQHHEYFDFFVFKDISYVYIRSLLHKHFKYPFILNNLRLFTKEGVEIFESDIQYLSNGEILYASKGENYDTNVEYMEYKQLKILGSGGFGQVILGQHRKTNKKVALKFINTNFIGNARDIDMVFREIEMLKSLDHPGIVKIYNCHYVPPMQVVLVMEYLEGGELTNYIIERERLTEDDAREFFIQIAETVHYCHRNKLIHRDLKLENIVLEKSDSKVIKLIDFGIAQGNNTIDIESIDVGSLKYMAPEVLLKQFKNIGPQLDIWALGCILYCMIFGKLPFNGSSSSEIQKNICFSKIILPFNVEISPGLRRLILGMLTRDPHQRLTSQQIIQHPWVVGEAKNNIIQQQQILFLLPKLINNHNKDHAYLKDLKEVDEAEAEENEIQENQQKQNTEENKEENDEDQENIKAKANSNTNNKQNNENNILNKSITIQNNQRQSQQGQIKVIKIGSQQRLSKLSSQKQFSPKRHNNNSKVSLNNQIQQNISKNEISPGRENANMNLNESYISNGSAISLKKTNFYRQSSSASKLAPLKDNNKQQISTIIDVNKSNLNSETNLLEELDLEEALPGFSQQQKERIQSIQLTPQKVRPKSPPNVMDQSFNSVIQKQIMDQRNSKVQIISTQQKNISRSYSPQQRLPKLNHFNYPFKKNQMQKLQQ